MSNIFGPYGFELIDMKPQSTHGGSMRFVFARKGKRPVSSAVRECLAREEEQGLHLASTFDRFREKCEKSRNQLVEVLKKEKKQDTGWWDMRQLLKALQCLIIVMSDLI